MRDILIVAIVLAGSIAALRKPWIGIILWTWLSLMNPHRYAYGFSYDAPLAAMAAGSTMLGLLFTRERYSPMLGAPAYFLAAFSVWITLSWSMGMDPSDDYFQWSKVMKVFLMTFVGLALLRTKQHLMAFVWVAAGSLALLGAKGGVFTITTGGNFRVWGPPGTFIEDNNEFALALILTIPLLRFLQLQMRKGFPHQVMTVVMLLCAAAALGSQSRGAFLAIIAMALLLWWRGRSRFVGGVLIAATALALLAFMPEEWAQRMSSIDNYEEDGSAMGRISAWWTAYGIAKNYPLGVGFNIVRPELFERFSPYPEQMHAAHSIYFLVLGNHGFVGLALFLGVFVGTWIAAGRLRKRAAQIPEARWVADLAAMCQVSILGYAVGGAFLSLSYFDLPYDVMMMVLIARSWLARRAWETEPAVAPGWRGLLGRPLPRPKRA